MNDIVKDTSLRKNVVLPNEVVCFFSIVGSSLGGKMFSDRL